MESKKRKTLLKTTVASMAVATSVTVMPGLTAQLSGGSQIAHAAENNDSGDTDKKETPTMKFVLSATDKDGNFTPGQKFKIYDKDGNAVTTLTQGNFTLPDGYKKDMIKMADLPSDSTDEQALLGYLFHNMKESGEYPDIDKYDLNLDDKHPNIDLHGDETNDAQEASFGVKKGLNKIYLKDLEKFYTTTLPGNGRFFSDAVDLPYGMYTIEPVDHKEDYPKFMRIEVSKDGMKINTSNDTHEGLRVINAQNENLNGQPQLVDEDGEPTGKLPQVLGISRLSEDGEAPDVPKYDPKDDPEDPVKAEKDEDEKDNDDGDNNDGKSDSDDSKSDDDAHSPSDPDQAADKDDSDDSNNDDSDQSDGKSDKDDDNSDDSNSDDADATDDNADDSSDSSADKDDQNDESDDNDNSDADTSEDATDEDDSDAKSDDQDEKDDDSKDTKDDQATDDDKDASDKDNNDAEEQDASTGQAISGNESDGGQDNSGINQSDDNDKQDVDNDAKSDQDKQQSDKKDDKADSDASKDDNDKNDKDNDTSEEDQSKDDAKEDKDNDDNSTNNEKDDNNTPPAASKDDNGGTGSNEPAKQQPPEANASPDEGVGDNEQVNNPEQSELPDTGSEMDNRSIVIGGIVVSLGVIGLAGYMLRRRLTKE